MSEHTQQEEVDRNYKAFKKMLSELIESDTGRFALMQNGELVACFDTNRDTQQAGNMLEGKLFSIQKITNTPVDLGSFSHARILRPV